MTIHPVSFGLADKTSALNVGKAFRGERLGGDVGQVLGWVPGDRSEPDAHASNRRRAARAALTEAGF